MTPLLGKPLTEFVFVDPTDANAVAKAEEDLRQTEITQPAVMAIDLALTRLLAAYGIQPDMTMGHSLGEYGALVAAGAMPFKDALEAVSARGRGMTQVSMGDNGRMAAVFAPLGEIERVLKAVDGYVVIANINSHTQAVIGGASKAVEQAMEILQKAGYNAVPLPVSHAFHTSIVAPASEPLRRVLERLHLESPHIPVVANVNGEFYPRGPQVVPQMLDILARQVASPVQFIQGLRTLYDAGARVFVEVGPKKALQGFAEDVLGGDPDVLAVFTNHPKVGDIPAFNQALCGLYAAGLGVGQGVEDRPGGLSHDLPVTITGAALGLPGTGRIFDDGNVARILRGDQCDRRDSDALPPSHARQAHHPPGEEATRAGQPSNRSTTCRRDQAGGPRRRFRPGEGIWRFHRAPGRSGPRHATGDGGGVGRAARRRHSAGDALQDHQQGHAITRALGIAGRHARRYRRDFRFGFPGLRFVRGLKWNATIQTAPAATSWPCWRACTRAWRKRNGDSTMGQEMARRIDDLRAEMVREPYSFDRRFLFHILSMGHSQFAEFIGARGPNTQINAACASTTQAVSLANDWIRGGRCRRVIVISADDITTDHLIEWFGAGFLASGAAATDE